MFFLFFLGQPCSETTEAIDKNNEVQFHQEMFEKLDELKNSNDETRTDIIEKIEAYQEAINDQTF